MRCLILAVALLSAPLSARAQAPDSLAANVDPFVIRECYGHAAGYRYDDPTIEGFSHTHFSGSGHTDLGDILVMPVSGDAVPMEPGIPAEPGYRSRFSHASEVARPGYYAVTLDGPSVRAELTAGTRIGVHRYAFPRGRAAHLVIDLRSSLYNYPGKVLWSGLHLRPDGTLTGFRETRGWAPGRTSNRLKRSQGWHKKAASERPAHSRRSTFRFFASHQV
jgi:hypothetical protein